MVFKKRIRKRGIHSGMVVFNKDERDIYNLRLGDIIEVTYVKAQGAEHPAELGEFKRVLTYWGSPITGRSVGLALSPETMQVFGAGVGDIIDIDFKVIGHLDNTIKHRQHPPTPVISEDEARIQKQLDEAEAERIRREIAELRASQQDLPPGSS